ncbi:hypothetical protein J6590_001066 [Homalodisca vitripennis]|nr:hypothetical protein J6590_001066 [Homalodisca vitripennis]
MKKPREVEIGKPQGNGRERLGKPEQSGLNGPPLVNASVMSRPDLALSSHRSLSTRHWLRLREIE